MKITTNYKFNKPDLTDPADITQLDDNWDTIDTELSKRNIKSYTSLAQLGLSDSNLSATDFKSNIIAIVTALSINSSAIITLSNSENLNKSVIAQVNTDVGLAMPNTVEGWLYIDPNSYAYRPYFVTVMFDRELEAKAVFSTIVNRNTAGDLVSPFVVERDPKGFVSKGGDTIYGELTINDRLIMKNSLIINAYDTDYRSSFNDYNESTEIRSEKTDGSGDYDALIMYNENKMSAIDQKLKFRVCKNKESKDYAIYGEHNKPTPNEIDGTIPIEKGGTNATDVETARANLGFVSGSYDGTGSPQTITIKGAENRNVIFIWASGIDDSLGAKGYFTPQGGVMTCGTINDQAFNTETVGIRSYSRGTQNNCYFENGKLYIKSMSSDIAMNYINKSKVKYYYQVV